MLSTIPPSATTKSSGSATVSDGGTPGGGGTTTGAAGPLRALNTGPQSTRRPPSVATDRAKDRARRDRTTAASNAAGKDEVARAARPRRATFTAVWWKSVLGASPAGSCRKWNDASDRLRVRSSSDGLTAAIFSGSTSVAVRWRSTGWSTSTARSCCAERIWVSSSFVMVSRKARSPANSDSHGSSVRLSRSTEATLLHTSPRSAMRNPWQRAAPKSTPFRPPALAPVRTSTVTRR